MDKLPYREFIAMMQERTREADVPYNGSFELTPLCNLDCKMCYVHLQDPSVRHRMLSGEQWISLIQQAIDELYLASITKGEDSLSIWEKFLTRQYQVHQYVSVNICSHHLVYFSLTRASMPRSSAGTGVPPCTDRFLTKSMAVSRRCWETSASGLLFRAWWRNRFT